MSAAPVWWPYFGMGPVQQSCFAPNSTHFQTRCASRSMEGHGSAPQTTIDPIVIAARTILSLQTIPSREVKPGNGGGHRRLYADGHEEQHRRGRG